MAESERLSGMLACFTGIDYPLVSGKCITLGNCSSGSVWYGSV